MAVQEWLVVAFTVFCVSLILGLSTFLAFAQGARFGAGRAAATALGNAGASTLQAVVASVGLGAIIMGSALLFSGVKYAGTAYLTYVGVQMWRGARDAAKFGPGSVPTTLGVVALRRGGFTVGLGNPKAIVFFAALFPQFLSQNGSSIMQLAGMTVICGTIAFLVEAAYAIVGNHIRRLKLSGKAMTGLQRGVGGLLVVSDIRIALSRTEG